MNLQDVKAAYLARHWASLDDSARDHVHKFVEFLEAALAALDPAPAAEAEASAMPAVVAAVTEDPAPPVVAEAPPEAPAVDPAPEAAPAEAQAAPETTLPADPPAA